MNEVFLIGVLTGLVLAGPLAWVAHVAYQWMAHARATAEVRAGPPGTTLPARLSRIP